MDKNIITLEFQTTKKDYIELVKYVPISRLLYWIQLGGVFLISVANYIDLTMFNGEGVESGTELASIHIIAMASSVLFFMILGTASHFAMMALYKSIAKKLFNQYSHGNHPMQQVILDKGSKKFLVGKVHQRIPMDRNLSIVSTKQNYLFYYTKDKKPDKFCIPKKGGQDFEHDLQEVMNYMLENKNIRYHSKKH